MGQKNSRTDFEWTYNAEPHASRRVEILKKHPEVKDLYGPDKNLKFVVLFLVTFQILSLFIVKNLSGISIFIMAYCVSGTINHALTLAVHEASHNLAFGHSNIMANRIFGMFANLPIIFPFSVSFKIYHMEHHKYQGIDQIDTDIPTKFEADLFCTTIGKLFWMILQPLFYILRPMFVCPKSPTPLELINTVVQLTFDIILVYVFGWKCLLYLLGGTFLAMGVHPVAGHFISEHYMFKKGFETYSYYGPLNYLTFHVGYHNEHHDFPYIPGSRLHKVREIAPEFYDDLPHHTSWLKVIYDFVMDPAVGPYARIKRQLVGLDKKQS